MKNDYIEITVKTHLLEKIKGAMLVATIESEDSVYYWGGTPFELFNAENKNSKPISQWKSIHHVFKLNQDFLENKELKLKVFIWNRHKNNFLIDDFEIKIRKGNPILYGLIEPI